MVEFSSAVSIKLFNSVKLPAELLFDNLSASPLDSFWFSFVSTDTISSFSTLSCVITSLLRVSFLFIFELSSTALAEPMIKSKTQTIDSISSILSVFMLFMNNYLIF